MSSCEKLAKVAVGEEFPRNLMELLDKFGTDETCLGYLSAIRWPDGFICPVCGSRDGWMTARGTMYCRGCDRQTSPTAGTILHNSRTPIRKWFVAAWLLYTQKTGVNEQVTVNHYSQTKYVKTQNAMFAVS